MALAKMKTGRGQGMLLVGRKQWTLCSLNGDQPLEALTHGSVTTGAADTLFDDLHDHLGNQGISEVVLALETDLCLSTNFQVGRRKRLRNRDALLYQVEETLPVAAEEIAADFVVHKSDVFAVCCEQRWLSQLISRFAEQQIKVLCVSPVTALMLSSHLTRSKLETSHVVLWKRADSIELVAVSEDRPLVWESLPPTDFAVERTLSLRRLAGVATDVIATYGDCVIDQSWHVSRPEGIPNTIDDDFLLTEAIEAASRIIAGKERATINLLRGLTLNEAHSSTHPLQWEANCVQVAALLLIMASIGYFFQLANNSQRTATEATAAQAETFRQVFPEARVPNGVRSRLASELRRLKGVRGEEGAVPKETPAIELVRSTLKSLPNQMRFRLLEIRVERGSVYIEGQVRSHSDADRIATALRKRSFEVTPPSTQQLPEKGVDFRLTATLSAEKEQA